MNSYLGDSVYAEWDGYAVVLTTRNGLPTDPSNEIALDEDVVEALFRFVKRIEESRRQADNEVSP